MFVFGWASSIMFAWPMAFHTLYVVVAYRDSLVSPSPNPVLPIRLVRVKRRAYKSLLHLLKPEGEKSPVMAQLKLSICPVSVHLLKRLNNKPWPPSRQWRFLGVKKFFSSKSPEWVALQEIVAIQLFYTRLQAQERL